MLSESVAKAMELTGGPVVSETVKFITMMDTFFDCLNVDNYSSGFTQRKPFKQPYRSANDLVRKGVSALPGPMGTKCIVS